MKSFLGWRACAVFYSLLACAAAPLNGATLELYGTFEAMGVNVSLDAADDPDGDATAAVEYRTGEDSYRQGFPLSRVTASTHELLAGSLFWLDPGTSYDVRVTCADPDGGALDGLVLTGSASTRAEISFSPSGNAYYVSPSGSDTGGDGSIGNPWASLSHALQQAYAGDEIVLRGGVYYEGGISLPRSGTAGAPIIIRGYAGETAVLDGADPQAFAWAYDGNGVYRTTVTVANPNLVAADGARLLRYTSLSDLQALKWGIPGCYVSGTSVYVKLSGGADPNNAAMSVSRYNYGLLITQDFIYLRNLTFTHYGCGSLAKAIYMYNASDNVVDNCTFALNDTAIAVKYDSHRNIFQDSLFYDTVFDWPWAAFTEVQNVNGLVVYTPHTGRGTVIRRNEFHDFFDGMIVCPTSVNPFTNETDVYDNLVYECCDDGMETDGHSSNVRIWGNTFHDMVMGISMAPAYTGPTYAVRNVLYGFGAGNNNWDGSPFKFNSGYGPSGPIFLFHNTCDALSSGTDGLCVLEPGEWDMIYARNNIWLGTRYAVFDYLSGQPMDLDYDVLWNNQSGNLVYWWGGTYSTLQAFAAATGQESHGLCVDPGFAGSGNGDYTLNSSSALVDAGVFISGINDLMAFEYMGGAPDIGALEYAPYAALGDEDGDGLLNYEEDLNMDGRLGTGETDASDPDTDNDGFSDFVEVRSGSGAADPGDVPGAIRVNFIPAGSDNPADYCPDSASDYSSAKGYGWTGS